MKMKQLRDQYFDLMREPNSLQVIAYSDGLEFHSIASLHIFCGKIEAFDLYYKGELSEAIIDHPEYVKITTKDYDKFKLAGVADYGEGEVKLSFEKDNTKYDMVGVL